MELFSSFGVIVKTRILFFNGTLGAGGAERVMAMIANQLYIKGENVEILLYHDDPIFFRVEEGLKVSHISALSNSHSLIKNLFILRKYISENADIVISFNASMNIYVLLSMLGLKKKIIVADRNDPRHIPKKALLRKVRNLLYHFADGIVVQNSRNRDYFDNSLQKKSTIIYNPVEMNEYRGKAIEYDKKRRIVSVGRTTPQKNQVDLIDAFCEVKKKYPDYSLSIYGEGPLRDELRQYANSLGIGDAVELPGAVKNIYDKIIDADIFAMSSYYEGMPNALIEAMVLGLPVVSTRVSGATDLIISGVNGLLVDVGDKKGLENALLSFIENPELRYKCSIEAVKVADILNVNSIIDQWLTFIDKIINE